MCEASGSNKGEALAGTFCVIKHTSKPCPRYTPIVLVVTVPLRLQKIADLNRQLVPESINALSVVAVRSW